MLPSWCAVVARPDDQRVVPQPIPIDGIEDAAGGPVEFLHTVAVGPIAALALEGRGRERRRRGTGHRMRQVEKEWSVRMAADEVHSLQGAPACEFVAVDRGLDDSFAPQQWERRPCLPGPRGHVVAVGDAKKLVEPLPCRQKLGLVAEMPLAEDARCIAGVVKEFGKRLLLGIQASG
jgi:hypothetical protein